MVEGPTAKKISLKISKDFTGEFIRDIYIKSRRIRISPKSIVDKRVKGSETYGKNILIIIDDVVIRVHLMMFGAIHIYDLNEDLLKPEKQVRLILYGERKKLVVYNAPIIEIDYADNIMKILRRQLGPDPLRDDWNFNEAINKILKRRDEKIGVVLLDQSVIAGIGNILRNEILFRAKVHPERLVKSLSNKDIINIVNIAEKLCKEFLNIKLRGAKLKPILYVYNRYNQKCKVCGNKIKFYMQKPINRKTFVCEKCQK